MIDPTSNIEIVDPQMSQVLAGKSEAERLQIGWGMWRTARRMLDRMVRFENADWNDQQVQGEINRRLNSER